MRDQPAGPHDPAHDDEPLRRPTWMKVAALICLVAAIALVIIGMIP